jgi:hypothetical protein
VIVSLAQERVREAVKTAAREQAWTDGRGVRGIPTRMDGADYDGSNWDVTAVFDHIDRAHHLVWHTEELTVQVRGDYTRHFRIVQPGQDDGAQVDIVGSGPDWLIRQPELRAVTTAKPVAELCWEVDGPDGVAIYRSRDIDLADDMYRSAPTGSHLLPVLAIAGRL